MRMRMERCTGDVNGARHLPSQMPGADNVDGGGGAAFTGDMISNFLIYGDLRDLTMQGFRQVSGQETDALMVVLSTLSLAGDLGWLDGPIPDPADGVNLAETHHQPR